MADMKPPFTPVWVRDNTTNPPISGLFPDDRKAAVTQQAIAAALIPEVFRVQSLLTNASMSLTAVSRLVELMVSTLLSMSYHLLVSHTYALEKRGAVFSHTPAERFREAVHYVIQDVEDNAHVSTSDTTSTAN